MHLIRPRGQHPKWKKIRQRDVKLLHGGLVRVGRPTSPAQQQEIVNQQCLLQSNQNLLPKVCTLSTWKVRLPFKAKPHKLLIARVQQIEDEEIEPKTSTANGSKESKVRLTPHIVILLGWVQLHILTQSPHLSKMIRGIEG